MNATIPITNKHLTPTHSILLPEGEIWLKREDFNKNGSHKDRGIPTQIDFHLSKGAKGFVLSSSGNAAISAANYCQEKKIPLILCLSPKTLVAKIQMLQHSTATVLMCEKPINFARAAAKILQFTNLRASQDPAALPGYASLGEEISAFNPDAIFTYLSSGTSLLGLSRGLKKAKVAFHPVQNFPQCDFMQLWDKTSYPTSEAISFSLGIKNSPRKAALISLIEHSKGAGVIVGASLIQETQQLLQQKGIETSLEGICAVAAWRKLKEKNYQRPLCILTGVLRPALNETEKNELAKWQPESFITSYLELKETLTALKLI